MNNAQLSGSLSKEQAYTLVDAVMEREDLALTASAHEGEDGAWIFQATCQGRPDLRLFNALAQEVLGGKVGFSAERIDPEIDWVKQSLEGLKPVTAGGFYVYGAHSGAKAPTGFIPLHIEAAQAFGTGHHETTTGCLEAIQTLLKRKKPHAMLDVGTGTGILAMALAKRTRRHVIASDIDPVCVETTRQNAKMNGVGNEIIALKATGLDHRMIRDNGPYDLIVANILAGPLAKLAPAIGRATMPGGSVILSGILVPQAARIKAAYGQQGFLLKDQLIRGEWATLVLEKVKGQKRLRP